MTREPDLSPEETLDPENWDDFRRFAHDVLDDAMDYLATLRERSAWQPVPEAVRERLQTPVPREGRGEAAAYAGYRELVAPYPLGNIHPRFWGWVIGTGTPLGVLAEMLTATMNTNAAGHHQGATFVELQVIEWLRELMGFPKGASGILASGGSVANQIALAVARNARAPFDVREQGLSGGPRLMVYSSAEAHNSVQRAVELLGMGSESFGVIPVRDDFTIDVEALRARIANDRAEGRCPFCVVANAGTVNSGAVDPLDALADVCREEGLWLHVDGAFGALAVLDPASRTLLKGMERADSLAFDLHKWMYLPYEVACTLIRDKEEHTATFAHHAHYLAEVGGGIATGPVMFADYGPQLSRNFRALKVWLNLQAYGTDRFARLIAQNIRQAAWLADRVRREPDLELLAPVPLNIVNFRYRANGMGEQTLNHLNARILAQLQERGIAVPSSTELNGRFALRVAITNHRSRREDFEALVQAVLTLGPELAP
ncbi:MAG: aminotransferase class I/II-fold pyridoxal phosphate-dependent enzyme [Gammaproteobacteria bacterium]|jgi:glutamate/tyrosine decarboxylase-like PLP-dependent enzyme